MIFTIKGQEVLVDNCDADALGQSEGGIYTCSIHKHGYVIVGRHKPLHKIIQERMGFRGACDHANRNKLDNRRSNLRPVTKQGNKANSNLHSNNTSGYKGVSWSKSVGKWCANIRVNGRLICLGYYTEAEEAAAAYDTAAVKYFREYAATNNC